MKNIDVIETTLLRGRVKLLQPKIGFHASTDSVFLAAAVSTPPSHPRTHVLHAKHDGGDPTFIKAPRADQTPAFAGVAKQWKMLDIGCGVGTIGLCVLARNKSISLTGLDIQAELIDLARQNALLNGVEDQSRFFHGSLLNEKLIEDNQFNVVVMNPPYMESGTHTPSPEKIKAASHGEGASGASLADWVKYAHRKLKQGGHLSIIHRADRLDDVILELEKKNWFGSVVVYPMWSHTGEDAKRVIIQARKERYAPLILKAGIVIHCEDGKYTKEADAVLSDAAAITL